MGDALLQDRVGRETDSVEETLSFEIFVEIRRGEGGIAPERMIARPARRQWLNPAKAQAPKIKLIDKNIDDMHRIVFTDPVIPSVI